MPSIGGKSITTQTEHNTSSMDHELNISPLVFHDLVNCRDSINLKILIKIQQKLNITTISPERLEQAFESYLAYCFTQWESD